MGKERVDIEELRRKAKLFILNFLGRDRVNRDFAIYDYEKILEVVLSDLISSDIGRRGFMLRLAGQSGSGKSSQLLPAAKSIFAGRGSKSVIISVRNFAKYHPFYKEIEAKYGLRLIREKTNGFALYLLFLKLERLISDRYDIIFEVTLLDRDFERYISALLRDNGYIVDYHIMAVSKEQSDIWIKDRARNDSSMEQGREVSTYSSDYFYKALPLGIAAIGDEDKRSRCFLWSSNGFGPVVSTRMGRDEILIELENYRNLKLEGRDVEILLLNKKAWFKRYYKEDILF